MLEQEQIIDGFKYRCDKPWPMDACIFEEYCCHKVKISDRAKLRDASSIYLWGPMSRQLRPQAYWCLQRYKRALELRVLKSAVQYLFWIASKSSFCSHICIICTVPETHRLASCCDCYCRTRYPWARHWQPAAVQQAWAGSPSNSQALLALPCFVLRR